MKRIIQSLGTFSCIAFLGLSTLVAPPVATDVQAQQTATATATATEAELEFRWAFGATIGPPDKKQLVPIKHDTTLHEGDQIQFLIGLKKTCHVYLIYRDIQDELMLLYPDNLEAPAPNNTAWRYNNLGPFTLDNKIGTTRVYLLASAQPLTDLESRLAAYMAVEPNKKAAFSKDVIQEIRRLRKAHMQLVTIAERPANLAGVTRGDPVERQPNLRDFASEIPVSSFYAKTFTIEQQ